MASVKDIKLLLPENYQNKYEPTRFLELFTDELYQQLQEKLGFQAPKESFVSNYIDHLASESQTVLDEALGTLKTILRPRPLAKHEIDFILDVIPAPPGVNVETRAVARLQIQQSLRDRLIRLDLTPAAIPEFINNIYRKYHSSLIESGSSVGAMASEAISAPITQLTLNTFKHTSGSRKTSGGLEALKKLFYLTASANFVTTVEFKSKSMTYDDIFVYRNKTKDIRFQDIILDALIYDTSDIYPSKCPWAHLYLSMTNQTLPKTDSMLRITLDVNKLVGYNLSIQDLIQNLMKGTPPNIVVIPSPLALGFLDIYPDESSIASHTFPSKFSEKMDLMMGEKVPGKQAEPIRFDFMPSTMFLKNILYPSILHRKLSGVTGIKDIYPVFKPIYSIVLEEIKQGEPNEWFLVLDYVNMKKTNITQDDLEKLLTYVGIDILYYNDTGYGVGMPADSYDGSKYPLPSAYIKKMVEADNRKEDEAEAEAKNQGIRGYIHPPTELQKLSRYWYVEAAGDNFYDLIMNPEVDPYHTYSNNIKQIYQILGIEATRNLLISEIRNIILNEEYINPRHILLLVDIMTNIGYPTALKFNGAALQGKQALVLASFQQSFESVAKAASYGQQDSMYAISQQIIMGQNIGVGSGFIRDNIKNQTTFSPSRSVLITKEEYKKDYYQAYLKSTQAATPLVQDLSQSIQEKFGDLLVEVDYIREGEEEDHSKQSVYNPPMVSDDVYVQSIKAVGPEEPLLEPVLLAPPGLTSPMTESVIRNTRSLPVLGTPVTSSKVLSENQFLASQAQLPPVGTTEQVVIQPGTSSVTRGSTAQSKLLERMSRMNLKQSRQAKPIIDYDLDEIQSKRQGLEDL
jgi:hypothetical protein